MKEQIAQILIGKIQELGLTYYRITKETGINAPTIDAMLGKTNNGYNIKNLSKMFKLVGIKEVTIDNTTIKL